MRFTHLLLLLATTGLSLAETTFTKQNCRTSLATTQGDVSTTTKVTAFTYTRTIRTISTPTSTVTLTSLTVSTTDTITSSTTTTLPQYTSTFYTTESFTETNTESTTIIQTSTISSTVSMTSTYPTTTIQPSTGFVPLASALAAAGNVPTRKGKRSAKFNALGERDTKQQIICNSDGSLSYNPPQYAGSVTCYQRVEVISTSTITYTARTTSTITAPQGTVTSISYDTITSTVTETPIAASTTITQSTTSTLTITSTITQSTSTTLTTTTTSYAPAPTYYAACATNNVVSYVNSNRIYNINVADPNNGFSFGTNSADAYGCCAQCVQSGTCGGYSFHPASGTCYFFPFAPSGTCSPTSISGTFYTQTGTRLGFVLGDSNCAELEYDGQN